MAKRRHCNRSSGKRVRSRAAIGSSDLEKGLYVAVISFAVALTALLAHGAAYSRSYRSWSPIVFEHHAKAGRSLNPIYGRSMLLNERYDSRPYWHGSRLTIGAPTSRETADLAIEHLIPCESGGRIVDRLDTNGKMSYGILQFQDWPEWERMSGISGDPDNPDDAIRMAEWGIQHGMIDHWACARILGEI
jgi:hypothetical protein